jgi:hypothetical protein
MQQSGVDEDDAWELEQSFSLGSRFANASRRRGRSGTSMFVYRGDGFTAGCSIRARPQR